jgi:hypothetical protein
MRASRFTSLLLAVFVIVGLVAAPLVGPAMAKASSTVAMADMAASSADSACCPEKNSSKDCQDCQDCPLAAMCMLSIAQAVPTSASEAYVRTSTRTVVFAVDDLVLDDLNKAPPHHPPRILV